MADLYNDFPSWGETGSYPADGFFYEGGDQVNEKHMDALWNGIKVHLDRLIGGVEERVFKIEGDVILDGGLVASQGTNTREVDVSASTEGAYVDGQYTGSTSATTLTLSTNGSGSTRTDSIWVDIDGNIGATEGTTSVGDDKHKIAEVDVNTSDSISDVRNYGHDQTRHWAAEEYDPNQVPGGTRPGDFWHDLNAQRVKVRQSGAFRKVLTDQDSATVTAGDGLKGGGTLNLDGGSVTINVEPNDFAGDGLKDDGSDNLAVEPSNFAGTGLVDDGSDNLALDTSYADGRYVLESGDTMSGVLTIEQADPADFARWRNTTTGDELRFRVTSGNVFQINAWDSSASTTRYGVLEFDPSDGTAQFERGIDVNGNASISSTLDMENGPIDRVNYIDMRDRDGDGNYWRIIEDSGNGHLNFESEGGGQTMMDLEHNGNLRIEGELTETAAL